MVTDHVALIVDLLRRAEAAHGEYETKVLNGVYDQNWPTWYAEWALARGLNNLLAQPVDAGRLATVLNNVHQQYKQTDQRQSWAEYTAGQLAAMFD